MKILIIGEAGQGVQWLAAKIANLVLADPKKFVTTLAEYEAGVRSGESRVQILISDKEINCPFIDKPDILVDLIRKRMEYKSKVVSLAGEERVNEIALGKIKGILD